MWVQIDADPFKEGSTELCVSESKKKGKKMELFRTIQRHILPIQG